VGEGPARSLQELASLIGRLDWEPFLSPHASIEVHATTRQARLRHRDTAARKVQHALADKQRALRRRSPPFRGRPPTLKVHVHLHGDQAEVSVDAAGELLHRRGWRAVPGRAPLRENLAACLLQIGGWQGDEAFVDPFCGVGTIPIEAALAAAGHGPFGRRTFSCDAWPGARLPAQRRRAPTFHPTHPIVGADRETMALGRCTEHAAAAGVSLRWQQTDVADLEAPAPTGLIVTNPPYGKRLGERVGGVYATFGRTLRARFVGWRALFLSPTDALAQKVHRDVTRITRFSNGGTKVGVYAIEL